ncbi:hypothetical protein LNTAR_24995 [Lentisphaera araneosa HTCC2155]|jgi:hypothetical protein|uniref:Uncharacterized protein n=1 Tax=Lentisphaera araneosa HTCC2155 TaxID=313628 RepID=A6DRS6_9BACT|nr:hypothetical protein [Lentisphaera araneosa]EDM25611.1 hypothetical protein LNTAR_24995 [Lentisphaera araneosa HTCC2155]
MYRQLNFQKTHLTLQSLKQRISERFPESSLFKVCTELEVLSAETEEKAKLIAEPNMTLRTIIGFTIASALILIGVSISMMDFSLQKVSIQELLPLIDAVLNEIIIFGAALFFLVSLETRLKRAKALKALHEFRALAHVIDMHQLTKDNEDQGKNTASSPLRGMSNHELSRYLDYCSEMLSLTGKLAAFYAQNMPDSEVLSAVNDVEDLCNSLSRKIWQKIMIIKQQN